MADEQEPQSPQNRKRSNTAASATRGIASFTEDLVLNRGPAPGFLAATAQATSKAPTFGEIRRGSFGEEGWGAHQSVSVPGARGSRSGSGSSKDGDKKRSWSGSSFGKKKKDSGSKDSAGAKEGQVVHSGGGALVEPFAPLTEEPTSISEEPGRISEEPGRMGEDESVRSAGPHRQESENVDERSREEAVQARGGDSTLKQPPRISEKQGDEVHEKTPVPLSPENVHDLTDPATIARLQAQNRANSSGYIPPPQLPWTQSTAIALKAFWKWFVTPFGFLVTLYGLNVVAWGGMLFLLLCNASPAMCHAPVPRPSNQVKMPPAQALSLPGPYYINCNDINSPRRIWIEIDSQILNALFCVTGFGLVPWRFRDLYYILRYRFARTKTHGLEGKMYGLRVLAGYHRGWFRLPGSETLDIFTPTEYRQQLTKSTTGASSTTSPSALESSSSHNRFSDTTHDLRIPLPPTSTPGAPATSIRAPATKIWLMDFFIWCQVWNTFFQCCLCGFMWGQDRYDRPPWSTGLFVALACIIAGVGGVVSFVQGRRVKRVEGVATSLADAGVVVDDLLRVQQEERDADGTVESVVAEDKRDKENVKDPNR